MTANKKLYRTVIRPGEIAVRNFFSLSIFPVSSTITTVPAFCGVIAGTAILGMHYKIQ